MCSSSSNNVSSNSRRRRRRLDNTRNICSSCSRPMRQQQMQHPQQQTQCAKGGVSCCVCSVSRVSGCTCCMCCVCFFFSASSNLAKAKNTRTRFSLIEIQLRHLQRRISKNALSSHRFMHSQTRLSKRRTGARWGVEGGFTAMPLPIMLICG